MSSTPELPLLLGPGRGEPETLMLISEPSDAAGAVTIRHWSAADWSAAPTVQQTSAAALFAKLEDAYRHSRTMNQSLTQLRTWLRQ